jgi:hypothetical protein
MIYVKKKRAHEVMKWRQSVRLTEKQEAEREAVESKIQEHLKVLQYYIMFSHGIRQCCSVKC